MNKVATASGTRTHAGTRLDRARRLSDRVFSQLRPEGWLDRPIPERHRMLFYLGHLEAFDWNQLGHAPTGRGPDESLDRLFGFGIDPPPGELPQDRPADWPALERVLSYVQSTRRRVDDAVAVRPEPLGNFAATPATASDLDENAELATDVGDAAEASLDIAVEHRLMHVETLTYMLHALPYERRVVVPAATATPRPAPDRRRIEIPAGPATLGQLRGGGFGWDNEFAAHTTSVEPFAVDRHKITNGQYLRFVEDGGEPPPFWIRVAGGWTWRGFDAEVLLPLDHPVYATWEQADAYARWAGGTLPTEAQFHRYAFGTPGGTERLYPWGDAAPERERGSFDLLERDTISVSATPSGDSAFGVSQAVGNGWEWTRTVFAPFPGFTPFPSYPGYSAAFFDDQHYVLKGASCATDRMLLRRSFRNWFRPHYRHAYTTFRVVEG